MKPLKKLLKRRSEVVKRDGRYLVIVREEFRILGRVLWAGEWLQVPGSHISKVEALRESIAWESGKSNPKNR